MNWHKITKEQANEIIALNKKNQKVASLEEYASDVIEDTKTEFENVVGQDSLTRFDGPKGNKKRKNNRRKGNQGKNNTGSKKDHATTNRKPKQQNPRKNNKRKPQNSNNAAK